MVETYSYKLVIIHYSEEVVLKHGLYGEQIWTQLSRHPVKFNDCTICKKPINILTDPFPFRTSSNTGNRKMRICNNCMNDLKQDYLNEKKAERDAKN